MHPFISPFCISVFVRFCQFIFHVTLFVPDEEKISMNKFQFTTEARNEVQLRAYYRRAGAKHGYYSRYIVTSRLADSFLGIQFSVSRVNSSGRAKTQPADARGCNDE